MKYIKPTKEIKETLESIRQSIKNENVSYEELAELENLKKYIHPEDVLLREWAGIDEFEDYN
jgi:hypothetical protein